ncbi:hypothetical protein B0H14DRAFT_3468919 [Mycena olivaceomarginata]|nr:hypothetical protein B0H14DRAFT_3468919 [Mycena olivaceomarginata]
MATGWALLFRANISSSTHSDSEDVHSSYSRTIDGTGDALHRVVFSSRNPPSIIGPSRSNLRASTSLRFGAPSPPSPMPQPVVLHASLSRAAWTTTCTYSAIPTSAPLAYTLRRPTLGVDMRTDGNVRLVSIRNRHTLAHDSRRQGGIPLMLTEHAYPGDDRCTRGAPCLPTIPPAATCFPSLAARLPGALHVSQGAHSVMDTSTFFHFRCATQLSNAPCAELPACRNPRRLPSFSHTFSHHPLLLALSPLFPRARPPHFLLFIRASTVLPSPPPDPNPPRAVLLSGGPALYHHQPHLFLRHHHPRPAQPHGTSIEPLRTKARLKPKRSTTRTTARAFPYCTTGPFAAAPLLTPARTTHCGGSGQLFYDAGGSAERAFPCVEGFRSAGRTRGLCVGVPRLPVDARTSNHLSLTRPTCCAGVPSALSALALRRAGEEKAKYAFPLKYGTHISRRVFIAISLYLPADDINTSSISPCTARVIVVCSWLLLVVLELVVVVGMWLCHATIIFTTFLYRRYFSHPAAVHFHHQAGTFQLEWQGPPAQEDEIMKGEIMEDEIMKAEIGQTFTRKTKLSSVQLRLYAKAETIKAETMVGERVVRRANGYTRPQSCVAIDPRLVPDEITSRKLSGPAEALSPQSGLRFLAPLLRLDSVEPYQRARNLGP